MAKPKSSRNNRKNQGQSAGVSTFHLESHILNQVRLKEIADKSSVDFDRIAEGLRELTGQDISKELLKDSWDLLRVLLAEAVELRDRAMIHAIINEIIKRKEPKQQQIKTEGEVDHRVMVLVQNIEGKTVEDLIRRRNAITIGDQEARSVRAVADRRSSGEKRSRETVRDKD